MLSEQQCKLIETALTEDVEPRKVAAYFCLHMGLTLAEVAALRWQDIDLNACFVSIRNVIGRPDGSGSKAPAEFIPYDSPRTLPIPPHVGRYLSKNSGLYQSGICFVLTGETDVPAFYNMQNILTSICAKYKIANNLSATDLRNAFIRRCIQNGMDLYSICEYIGIKQPNVIMKRFEAYFTAKLDAVRMLERYSADYQTPEPPFQGPKRMNLLILGAGSQGPVVKEIAEAIGVFTEIAFLDDDPNNKLAIGPLSDYKKLVGKFPTAIPSFGNSELRTQYFNELIEAGYAVPRLIHPSATISNSNVQLGNGVVIEAKVIIGNGVTIEDNVILSAGCVLDKECVIHANSHVGCACTITKGSEVPEDARIPAGTVFNPER
jgi:acetyltransferase-like isoleucine patch superfamily enzyme